MKTAMQHLADEPRHYTESIRLEWIESIMLEGYRSGMEAAARMCGKAGDKIGLEHGVANYKTYAADGCYRCQTILELAAKTAQLP